jgi:20S proteasome alpha/beta subunit
MTLINAFRARHGGILLCADRQEDDGYSKNEIDKIYEITTDLKPCEVFIAGAGPSEIIAKAKEHIHTSLVSADRGGNDVLAEHQTRIEGSLRYIYKEYGDVLRKCPMGLIIVIAPRTPSHAPRMYSTVEYRLHSQDLYCADGSGKPISDYFADHLYKDGMDKSALSLVAAFILREVERKAVGVGMGFDMVFIHDGNQGRQYLGRDTIKKLQGDIPPLSEAVFPAWNQCPAIQEWLKREW